MQSGKVADMLPIRTILFPTDFSDHSRYAFALAGILARDTGSRLIVLHVITPPSPTTGGGASFVDPDVLEQQVRDKLRALAAQNPMVRMEQRVAAGTDAAAEILQAAKETECNLIVMGTHGRTGLGRLLMGSVAETVMRRAHCPVVTARDPEAHIAPIDIDAKTTQIAKQNHA